MQDCSTENIFSRLSRERKVLLAVTVVVFFISATLVMQTYFTMQLYNAADAACRTTRINMTKDELFKHAQAHKLTISILEVNGVSNQAKMGFTHATEDSCGCMISLADNRVSEVTDTFCQSL